MWDKGKVHNSPKSIISVLVNLFDIGQTKAIAKAMLNKSPEELNITAPPHFPEIPTLLQP